MDEDLPELPDDDNLAFMKLEDELRYEFLREADDGTSKWAYKAANYMNRTIATGQALNIDALSHWVPANPDKPGFRPNFSQFVRQVDQLLIKIRIHASRRSKINSVGFTEEQKNKIHALIEKIRTAVEKSSANVSKKETVFNILATLAKEVSKPRTPLARLGDLAWGLAGISRDVAEEGAEPWWKWAKLIFGEADEAKGSEPNLPAPEEIKKIEPPRKELPRPKSPDIDEEVPF